jgi:hypothetical protein
MYEVIFPSGNSNRFHANQLRERHTKDKEDENQLMVFHEIFNLPPPPINEPEVVPETEEPIIEIPNPIIENTPPPVIQNRRPQRNRRAPNRYSPG